MNRHGKRVANSKRLKWFSEYRRLGYSIEQARSGHLQVRDPTAVVNLGRDLTAGRIDPADLEQAADERCRRLFSNVIGPGDVLWDLHCDVARQAIALGALSASELGEWASVIRQREGRSR
jgi:hypothetical protein